MPVWPFHFADLTVNVTRGENDPEALDVDFDRILFDNMATNMTGLGNVFIDEETVNQMYEDFYATPQDPGKTNPVAPTQTMIVAAHRDPEEGRAKEGETVSGTDFSLNPFRLVYRGLKVPIIGLVDLSVTKATTGAKVWFSWVYRGMGMLSARIRLNGLGIDTRPLAGYNCEPAEYIDCPDCGERKHGGRFRHMSIKGAVKPASACKCQIFQFGLTAPADKALLKELFDGNEDKRLPSFPLTGETLMYDYDSAAKMSRNMFKWDPATDLCEHGEDDWESLPVTASTLQAGFDSMLFIEPRHRHRSGLRSRGLRCTVCYTTEMHGLHPKLTRAIDFMPWNTLPKHYQLSALDTILRWRFFIGLIKETSNSWFLTASSPERELELQGTQKPLIVLVSSQAWANALLVKFEHAEMRVEPFVVPDWGSPRHLSGWRYLLATAVSDQVDFTIVNAGRDARLSADIDHIDHLNIDWSSMCTGHLWPSFMGACKIRGGTHRTKSPLDDFAHFAVFGHVYGWDEVVPTKAWKPVTVTAGKHRPPGICAPLVDVDISAAYQLALIYSNGRKIEPTLFVTGLRRGSIFYLRRYLDKWNPFESMSFADIMFDPRPIQFFPENKLKDLWAPGDPAAIQETSWDESENHPYDRLQANDAKGENILQELTHSLGGIWINTFGTHGDVVPLLAIKNYLRSYGGLAFIQRLNTEEEGFALLDEALHGPKNGVTIGPGIFQRARSHVLSQVNGLHFNPVQLQLPGLNYSLQPPRDIISFFVPTTKMLLNIGYAIMSVFAPEPVRIGAYWRPGWVPRSADGKHFLKAVRNTQELEQLAAWGSDRKPPRGWENVPVVEPGDHVAQFSRAKIVITHGGAGTVQTAASCGARVISTGVSLDRAHRDPYDAGLGVTPGAPPDRIFLALSRWDIRFLAVWLRRNWTRPWDLFSWYGVSPIGMASFRLLMLYLIYSRQHKQTIVSTDPLATLILVVLKQRPTFLVMAGVYCFAKGLDRILDLLNINYMTVLKHFIRANWRMSSSVVGIYLCQRYNLAAGLLWTYLSPKVVTIGEFVTGNLLASFGSTTKATGHFVFIEYTLQFHHFIPYFHTALYSNGEAYEGVTLPGGELYAFVVRPRPRNPNSFLLKTELDWAKIKNLPRLTGKYGLAWNCQTGLMVQLRDHLPILGIGGFGLAVSATLASSIYIAVGATVYAYLALSAFIPTNIGLTTTKSGGVEMLAARVMSDITDTLMNSRSWTIVEVLDWWRTLHMPMAAANPQDDEIAAVLRHFQDSPILYQGDRETQDRAARSLGAFVIQGVPGTQISMLLANIYLTEDPESDQGQLYKAELARAKREILSDPDYLKLTLGVPGSSFEELQIKYSSWVPFSVFKSILGGKLTQAQLRPLALTQADKVRAFELIGIVQSYVDEHAAERTFLETFNLFVSSLTRSYYRVSIVLALILVGAAADITELDLKVEDTPLPVALALAEGARNYLQDNVYQSSYTDWHERTMELIKRYDLKDASVVFQSHFPDPDVTEVKMFSMEGILDDPIVGLSGEIIAAVVSCGAPDSVIEGLIKILPAALLDKQGSEDDSIDLALRKWLWRVFLDHGVSMASLPERLASFVKATRDFCQRFSLPLSLFNSLVNLMSTIGIAIYDILDKFIELLVGVVTSMKDKTLSVLQEYMYLGRAFLSVLLPEHRRRPKAVWALLFANDFRRLTPNEKFLMSCKMMEEPPVNQNYHQWASTVIDELDRTGLADFKLELTEPYRPIRYPKEPTTVDQEVLALAPLAPSKFHEATVVKPFIKKWLDSGVPQGLTGAWFADQEHVKASILRYDQPRPSEDDEVKAKILETADALADHYPQLYKNATWMRPIQTFRNLKIRYSPGLPFIPTFKSRRDLVKHGFLQAIVQVVENRLLEGINPGTMAHAFVKDDIVSLQKLIDGKNIREVVAQDLIGNVQKWCATLHSTRRLPPIDAWVMNAVPRSEGGFRPFYEEVKKRPTIVLADATQFDSTLAPVVTVDGLSRLRERGFEGQFGEDIIKSQIRSSYLAMRHCKIRDLQYGREFDHNGGLMTGQSDTSQDNKDSFRMVIIAAWSAISGKPPSQFWTRNTLGNAGDDDIYGSDESEEFLDKMMVWISDKLGVQMRIEARGFENAALTGLKAIGVPDSSIKYYTDLGMPVPNFAIACEREALLAKKTEFRLNVSRFKDVVFYMHYTDSLIGSAWLTCHYPGIYRELWDAYRSSAMYVLNRYFERVEVIEELDQEGNLVAGELRPGKPRTRYQGKTSFVEKWLKSHKYPTYSKLFAVWVKPIDQASSNMLKLSKRIESWIPTVTMADRITFGLLGVREFLYKAIPNHMARALPEFRGEDVTAIMRNTEYVVAKFVWLSLYHKAGKRVPTETLFRTALRENPYGSAEDPIGFLDWLGSGRNLEELASQDLEAYRGQMTSVTVIYYFIETIFKTLGKTPGLGWLIQLFALSTRDVNRVYATLNFVYMLSEGRSSPIISNMMPADPYAWIKQLSVILSCLFPLRWHNYPGLKHVVKVVPLAVETWAAVSSTASPRVFTEMVRRAERPTEWNDVANSIDEFMRSELSAATVLAGTGTGKSTAFLGHLFFPPRRFGTAWLLCPTNVAVQAYENPFVDTPAIQKLVHGVVNNFQQPLKVLTYGHFIQRCLSGEIRSEDLLLFDEMHLDQVEMHLAWLMNPANKKIILTATPSLLMPSTGDATFRYMAPRRFTTAGTHVRLDFVSLWQYLSAENPKVLTRALIVCPTLSRVHSIMQTLGRLSVAAYELSSDVPIASPVGVLVSTTIVDTAVTILPPPTCLIDLGEELSISLSDEISLIPLYKVEVVKTTPSTHTQRVGRVGRVNQGVAFHMTGAGTRTPKPSMASAFSFLNYGLFQNELCAIFGVRCLVEPFAHGSTVIRYFDVASELNVNMIHELTASTALYIAVWLSSGLTRNAIQNQWVNHRIGGPSETIETIIVDDILARGWGDPLKGDFDTAWDFLLAGGLVTVIGGQEFPTTALVVRINMILPCNLDPTKFVAQVGSLVSETFLPSRSSLVRAKRSTWIASLADTTREDDSSGGINASLAPFTPIESDLGKVTTLFSSPIYIALVAKVMSATRNLGDDYNLVNLLFDNDEMNQVAITTFHVQTHLILAARPGTRLLDVSDIGLPEGVSRQTLAVMISACMPDNVAVLVGDFPEEILGVIRVPRFNFIRVDQHPYFGSLIISSGYARVIAHRLYSLVQYNMADYYLTTLPHYVWIVGGHFISERRPNERRFGVEKRKVIYFD